MAEIAPVSKDMTTNQQSGGLAQLRRLASKYRGLLVLLGLSALALAVYLPYALKAGWYYDDWSLYSSFHGAGSSWSDQFNACTAMIPAGRKLTCFYHVTEYHFLTDHRTSYHLVSIAFLIAMSGLTYAVLRRCRMPWTWAALAAAILIVFPASDSTRLWPTGAIGQYVIVLELVGVLITLAALRLGSGWRRTALHITSGLIFVIAMASYEIAVPLVALNGIFYWAANRNRAALRRGAVDLALAIAFVAYRLILDPADPSEGFTVHRTVHGDLSRAWTLISDAWRTWHEAFLPGTIGTIGVVAVLVVAGALALRETEMRRRLLPWALFLAAGVVVAGASTFVFLTANDLYAPQMGTLSNRVTLPGTIAYVCVFVALLGFGYEIVRRFVPPPWVAGLAVVVVALGSAHHQLLISTQHKREWEASWSEQKKALAGYDTAARGIPQQSRIIGLGAPIWEPEYIPIFAAPWDLRGAIDYTTAVDPPSATPLVPTMFCGHRGMVLEGVPFTPYQTPAEPLYFLDAASGEAARVANEAQCRRTIARWGRPPFTAALPPA
jgi:hypothetical protein